MTGKALRRWSWVHTWSSLVSTVFLLLLCLTGLPLIFHHEIDHLLHEAVEPKALPAATPNASVDAVVQGALSRFPGKVAQFVAWEADEPHVANVFVNDAADADLQKNRTVRVDARTAGYLDAPDVTGRLTYILLRLHTDMFAGLAGKLFLGVMGLVFVVALVSGVVVYGPAMRKYDFGMVRAHRVRPVRWLDIHNLLGIVAAAWMIVVGLTGVINAWADIVIKVWQADQVAQMLGAHKAKPPASRLASLDVVVGVAQARLPDMQPRFVAFPGNPFSTPAHFIVFMAGKTPLTSRLLQPVVVDAETGAFTDTRPAPWYLSTLLLSQPLHFGDYGRMPLKIIWAVLDVMMIAVLVTGLYLWMFRRRTAAKPVMAGEAAPQDPRQANSA